jgi:hypothetical protein
MLHFLLLQGIDGNEGTVGYRGVDTTQILSMLMNTLLVKSINPKRTYRFE